MTPRLLADLVRARTARIACVLATRLADGQQRLLLDPMGADPDTPDPGMPSPGDDHTLAAAARACIETDRSARRTIDGADWFLHLHAPPARLIIVGAVHIAQSLAPMALLTGVDVVVCDPRTRYATAERFPGALLRHDWPDAAIAAERPGRTSAVVALSHDPKIDDPALQAALATPCGYVGALGSRRSHQGRLERLAAQGVERAALARILGPVGLDIHALGAGEIAVSILAEWIAHRRGAKLRERAG